MDLVTWAIKWGISAEAIDDLMMMQGISTPIGSPNENMQSESAVLSLVRKEASDKGARLWRNNVGAVYTKEGHFLRYGLANDSSRINSVLKSADLIGIRPIKITEKHVGYTIGQFMSREIKEPNWRYKGTEREKAQLNWAELIISLGGNACFTIGKGTI